MRIITLQEIEASLDLDAAIAAIRAGFIGFAAGEVQLGAVGHLHFPNVDGDCYIKSAAMAGSDVFAVKVATGFPHNPDRGLKASDGMMVVLDAATGAPVALLLDEGYLTDLRTAIAGALAAELILPPSCVAIGVIGTGIQARLQAEIAARVTGIDRIILWGRNAKKAARLASDLAAAGLAVDVAPDVAALTRRTRLVITTTPARTPLLTRANTVAGMRIVAVGADAPGKQEVETELVGSMGLLIADAPSQCLDYGEVGGPARSGLIDVERIVGLGSLLGDPPSLESSSSALVDLTGIGVQDLQIAAAVWRRVQLSERLA